MLNTVPNVDALAGGNMAAAAEEECSVAKDVLVSQQDLRFSHPQSVATFKFGCNCPTSNVLLECGPEWTQDLVSATTLRVRGDGTCALLGTFHRGDQPFFLYAHSPTLPLKPLSATFQC